MKKLLGAASLAALIGLGCWSAPVLAQTKTAKACQEEWRANKADYQARKITEKAYVEKCRAGESVDTSTAAPPAAAPSATPAAAPAPAQPATPPTRAARRPPTSTSGVGTPSGAGEFSTEAEAKGHCPGDLVVWANTKTKVYHFSGHKDYGNTKQGAYMCEKDATAGGFRAAKNEKRPS